MQEFEIITSIIKEDYGISKEQIVSKSRITELVEFRIMCAYILKIETTFTTMLLAKPFGFRQHSNIVRYCINHDNLYGRNTKYTQKFDSIYSKYKLHLETVKETLKKQNLKNNDKTFCDMKQKDKDTRIKNCKGKKTKYVDDGRNLNELDELSNLLSIFNAKFNRNYTVSSMYVSKKDGMQKIILTDKFFKNVHHC